MRSVLAVFVLLPLLAACAVPKLHPPPQSIAIAPQCGGQLHHVEVAVFGKDDIEVLPDYWDPEPMTRQILAARMPNVRIERAEFSHTVYLANQLAQFVDEKEPDSALSFRKSIVPPANPVDVYLVTIPGYRGDMGVGPKVLRGKLMGSLVLGCSVSIVYAKTFKILRGPALILESESLSLASAKESVNDFSPQELDRFRAMTEAAYREGLIKALRQLGL